MSFLVVKVLSLNFFIRNFITLSFFDKYFLLYSSTLVFYSCRVIETCFFKIISLLKIIKEEIITNNAPIKVLNVGISPQMKNPNIIAKTSAKYFKGVTKDTSEYLYD